MPYIWKCSNSRFPTVGSRHDPQGSDEGAPTEVVIVHHQGGLILDGVGYDLWTSNDSLPTHIWKVVGRTKSLNLKISMISMCFQGDVKGDFWQMLKNQKTSCEKWTQYRGDRSLPCMCTRSTRSSERWQNGAKFILAPTKNKTVETLSKINNKVFVLLL